MSDIQTSRAAGTAIKYAQQSEKLSLDNTTKLRKSDQDGTAVTARFITPLDPVIETVGGNRLPAIPVVEGHKLNALKDKVESKDQPSEQRSPKDRPLNRRRISRRRTNTSAQDDYLDLATPPSRTHPLFPPLPLYGPPSLLRNLQCTLFQITSFFLSTAFLAIIALGALFTFIPKIARRALCRLTFQDPDSHRPFYQEERRRAAARRDADRGWVRKQKAYSKQDGKGRSAEPSPAPRPQYEPLEGGPDKLVCSVRYYARRVGLDVEEFKVQTEDGFLIDLWHVYDPNEHTPSAASARNATSPINFPDARRTSSRTATGPSNRYPVLLMHGLLQSSGAFCCTDEDSLAFYLHKSGYDVWLGNNRCGFDPQHTLLQYNDPRMWAWNIRQMGVLDLPALVSRVLSETGFAKLGLVAHSQGTTQTFVALAKEQRPDLGDKISVFCALAPAVYAGPLIGKIYFKFMRIISPAMFRMFFGIHAFMPLMMFAHKIMPSKLYGEMGYMVFSFLFNWSDRRWDRGLRNRAFQFAPVYVSSESMRWWLGRECFARHRCILSTREVISKEEQEDQEVDYVREESSASEDERTEGRMAKKSREERESSAWYDSRVPPMALWIAGSDDLVDGRRLLRRFDRGREPCVNVVHKKVIAEYEHLDVLWAVDAIEKVGREVKEVIWKTISKEDKSICRPIQGVEVNDEKSTGC